MFEYQPNRFVNPKLIIGYNIYKKENVFRVAIDLNVDSTKENCVYSSGFDTEEKAKEFGKTIPVS